LDELEISLLSYTVFISCSYIFFILNLVYSVLDKFKNDKLLLNHVFYFLRTSSNLSRKTKGSGLLMIMLVSHKKSREEIVFSARGRSLM
jgi:hypothetical protein